MFSGRLFGTPIELEYKRRHICQVESQITYIGIWPEEYDLEECGMFFVLQEIKTAVNNMNNINSLGYVCGVHDNVNIW